MTTPQWIIEDLARSGLTPETFPVTPLKSKDELMHRLGFSKMGEVSIFEIGGYWIEYPSTEGFYRLKLEEPISDAKYLSPKGARNQAFIPPGVLEIAKEYKPDHPIYFTEGEKKSAKAAIEGFPCIGLSGVFNFTDSESGFLSELESLNFKHRTVYIVFDSDIIGKIPVRQAELRLAVELMNRGTKVMAVRLPDEPNREKNGLDDFLVRHGKEALEGLIKKARMVFEAQINEGTPTELILKEAAGIASVLDREVVYKLISHGSKVPVSAVRVQALKYVSKAEHEEAESRGEDFTEAERVAATELLNAPDALDKMLSLIERGGYVGEAINKLLLYLAFTSRLFDEAISCIIKGSSAVGKSALIKTVILLFPKEAVMEFSVVTERALLHLPSSLAHMILCVFERQGAEKGDYSIRTALSEKELSILIPVKNPETGNFETVEKRIAAEGLCYVETTTRDQIYAENQTRVFDLYLDETPEQTRNILLTEAQHIMDNTKALEAERRVWRCLQTMLEPYPVYLPFANQLAEVFPADKPRARRDFKRFLTLIQSVTLFYQQQRETTTINGQIYLKATEADFDVAVEIANVVLAQTLKELTPGQEFTLKAISEKFSDGELFSGGQLYECVKESYSYRTIQRYLKRFIKDGYLDDNGERGSKIRYHKAAGFKKASFIPLSSCRNLNETPANKGQTSGQSGLSSSVLMSSSSGESGHSDKSRQKGLSLSNANNSGLKVKSRQGDTAEQKLFSLNKNLEIESINPNTFKVIDKGKDGRVFTFLIRRGDEGFSEVATIYEHQAERP